MFLVVYNSPIAEFPEFQVNLLPFVQILFFVQTSIKRAHALNSEWLNHATRINWPTGVKLFDLKISASMVTTTWIWFLYRMEGAVNKRRIHICRI